MDYTCLGGRELWHSSTTHEGDVIGVIEHLDQANSAGEICIQRQVSISCYRRHHPIYKPLLKTTCARSEWTTILVISHCEDVAGSAWEPGPALTAETILQANAEMEATRVKVRRQDPSSLGRLDLWSSIHGYG